MKLCKDCKHFSIGFMDRILLGLGFGKCKASNLRYPSRIDLITGKEHPEINEMRYCLSERANYGDCGPEGNKWESNNS